MAYEQQRIRSRRGRRIVAWAAAGVVLLCGVGFGYVWFQLNGNIRGVDINGALGTDRPVDPGNGSMDILVLGSDTRSGGNAALGGGTDEGTARSDTAMIVHIYEGHKKATVVSIPRDTLIDRPACRTPEGRTPPAATGVMFNDSYAVGGPACAVKTVESMTGIRMDHYIEVDFSGFKNLIDALGGVKVTTHQAIHDSKSHLDLDAGTHTLNGTQALGLVRTRHGIGDGSDLGRIQLQQDFVKALIDRIDSLGTLANPAELYTVADTATSAITTDSELASMGALTGLAQSLKGLGSHHVTMVTMPVRYDPADPNRVLPIEAQADQVWKALRQDQTVPRSATKGSAASGTEGRGVVSSSS